MANATNAEAWFDTDENKVLLAICARHLIRNIGIGGIVWGAINLVFGAAIVALDAINIGVVVLGIVMLSVGIFALNKPTVVSLLMETVVAGLLLLWNAFISYYNARLGAGVEPRGLIFPLIVLFVFANYYRKLRPLDPLIRSVPPARLKAMRDICKAIRKKKIKDEPGLVQTRDGKTRIQLLEDRAFFVAQDLSKAFVVPRSDLSARIPEPEAKKLKFDVLHPIEKVAYTFDARNSEKLRTWLRAEPATA